MLTKLALQNFKAWEKCAIDLGRITVLIGPNGSGKSSLLQALGLLKQSRNQEAPVWNGPYESLGRFEDVVSYWSNRRRMQFQLSFQTVVPQNRMAVSGSFQCDYFCTLESSGPIEHKAEYRFNDSIIEIEYYFPSSSGWIKTRPANLFTNVLMEPNHLIAVPFGGWVRSGETAEQRQNARMLIGMQQSVRYLRNVILNQLGDTYVVKTRRPIDKVSYPGKPGGADFTESGDVANFIAYNDEARQSLSNWISRIFDDDIELFARFMPQYSIALELRRGRESTNVAHEGAGMQNIIWPLAQIAAAPAGSLIALEEPEVHLHPKAQARVGQVLTDIALTEDKQILITTQSEHILMSFLTEAVKSGASPDDFRVYYCTSHNRVAEIEELRLDPNGGLDGGLKGFFEAGFDETQRYLEALTARNSG